MNEDVIVFKERAGKAGGGKGILYDIDRTFTLQTLGEQICVYDARGNGDGETVNNLTGDHENRITDYSAVVCAVDARNGTINGDTNCALQAGAVRNVNSNNTVLTLNGNEDIAQTIDASYYKGCGSREGQEREAVMYAWDGSDISPTLTRDNANGAQRMHDKENFNHVVDIGRDAFNMGKNAQYGMSISEDVQPSMTAKGPGAVASHYIIRRLTPTECQRLQGFHDGWDIPEAADTKKYKMWGNGMAKPCVKYILSNIDEEENPHG